MTEKMKKRIITLTVFTAVFIVLIAFTLWGNTALEINTYAVKSGILPDTFDGYKIAHISDLHNAQIGDGNEKLTSMLKSAEPDIIVITGDLIDSRNTNIEVALSFAKEAVKIAPCYYVSGNHEARVSEYGEMKNGLTQLGVTVLEDEKLSIEKEDEKITLIGVSDPSFQTDYLLGSSEAVTQNKLSELIIGNDGYTLLLSHRPELFKIYAEYGVDLVFSGHAHGGQFRLPFIGGLAAPNQGLFPKYDAGLFTEKNTNMIVSRGIGNSIIPLRFNNRPEVVLAELRTK